MEPTKKGNLPADERLDGVDRAELEVFIQKRLDEAAGRANAAARLESLRILGNLLILFVLGLFIVSPFLQLFLRAIHGFDEGPLRISSSYVKYYQSTIQNIHYIVRFTAVVILLWSILYRIVRRREGISLPEKADRKQRLKRLVPLIVFGLFALDIVLVTIVRGPNEYDLTGHPYMFESIYSYISYPLVFFTCGVMLDRENYKKLLIYALLFTALPVNILALVNEWAVKVKFFNGRGVCAVFHNSNHYGYYLALTIIAGALTFAYEKKLILRIFAAISAVIAMVVLVINNTLGAYLAVLFVLILFVIYCFFFVKRDRRKALVLLGAFLLITLLMSISYNTVSKSVVKLSSDIGKIVEDPLEANSAGSKRWGLWKKTVSHMVESPWLGFGVEGMLNTYHVGTPHNEFLQYAAFFGIPAALLYIVACSMTLLRVFKSHKAMSKTTMVCFFVSLGYLASSLFGVTIYYTTPFFYIFLGLTYAEYFKAGTQPQC